MDEVGTTMDLEESVFFFFFFFFKVLLKERTEGPATGYFKH